LRMNRIAEIAQMESDDVAAVRVFNTGDRDMRARKIRIEDLSVLIPGVDKRRVVLISQ
jgi:hypothetical protein